MRQTYIVDSRKIELKSRRIIEYDQALTLKALPSVSLHLPPVGFERIFLQLLQATTVWA
jgi:hypothetical protein